MTVETKTLQFTEDWFTPHIPAWTMLFRDYVKGRRRFLELGSFEGRSACWLLENALDSDGELVCVDAWLDSPEFGGIPRDHVTGARERFESNIRACKGPYQHVQVVNCATVDALALEIVKVHGRDMRDEPYVTPFDFIYIDAGHSAANTLTDACMAWPLLKPEGVLVFDDYAWALDQPLELRPKIAIDAFLSCFHGQFEPLFLGAQVALRKIV